MKLSANPSCGCFSLFSLTFIYDCLITQNTCVCQLLQKKTTLSKPAICHLQINKCFTRTVTFCAIVFNMKIHIFFEAKMLTFLSQRLCVEILQTMHKHCFWQRRRRGVGEGGTRLLAPCGINPWRVSRVDFGVAPLPCRLPVTGLIPALRNAVMVTRHIQTERTDLFLLEFCATDV